MKMNIFALFISVFMVSWFQIKELQEHENQTFFKKKIEYQTFFKKW